MFVTLRFQKSALSEYAVNKKMHKKKLPFRDSFCISVANDYFLSPAALAFAANHSSGNDDGRSIGRP